MIVYIAGQMSEIKDFNFSCFDRAKKELIDRGYEVVSPADLNREEGFDCQSMTGKEDLESIGMSIIEIIKRDLNAVLKCDAIFMLPEWESSIGAKAELSVAQWANKKIFYHMPNPRRDNQADNWGEKP